MRRRGLSSGAGHGVRVAALAAALVVIVAAAAVGLTSRTTRVAVAATAPPQILLSLPGTSTIITHGLAGSSVSITPFSIPAVSCNPGTYFFDGTSLLVSPRPPVGSGALPTVTVAVPGGAGAGSHTFSLRCVPATGGTPNVYSKPFTVDPPPVTTTTAPPATTTTTTPKSTTTTSPGQTTTTAPGQTTTTVPGGTTTTDTTPDSTDTTDTTVPPDTVPGSTSTRSGSSLKFDALAIAPGSAVSAIGEGCDPDTPVAVTIDSTTVGRASSGDDGTFRTPLQVSSFAVGRYEVQATCGPVLTAPLDIVLASEVDTGTSTSMIIIVFFVLIGLLAFRRQLFPTKPVPATVSDPDDEDLEP